MRQEIGSEIRRDEQQQEFGRSSATCSLAENHKTQAEMNGRAMDMTEVSVTSPVNPGDTGDVFLLPCRVTFPSRTGPLGSTTVDYTTKACVRIMNILTNRLHQKKRRTRRYVHLA